VTWVYREPFRRVARAALAPSVAAGGTAYTAPISETWTTYSESVASKAVQHQAVSETWSTYSESLAGTLYYFYDDFNDAAIDTVKWSVINRVEDLLNGEIGCDEPANITLNAGNLEGVSQHLSSPHSCGDAYTAPANKNYSSWMIQQRKGPFIYPAGGEAIIDIRWKPGGGTGLWPAFWMLGRAYQANQPDTANIPTQDWPNGEWCEIDIAEFMGGSRTTVNCQIHNGASNPGGSQSLSFNASSQFAVYRLRWSSGSAIWQVNDESGGGFVTLLTVTGASVPSVPMYVVANVAMGGTGGGTPNDATLPQTSFIDYVRVIADAAQTPSEPPAPFASRMVARNTLLRM
jgi:hypothetical protein